MLQAVAGFIGIKVGLILLVSCGEYSPPRQDPDAGPDGNICDAGTVADVDQFGRQFYDAVCSALYRCDLFTIFQNKEECIVNHDKYFDGTQTKYLRGVRDALNHKTTTLNRTAMEQCFDELTTQACPVSLQSSACNQIFVGSRPPGTDCFSDEECAAPGGACVGLSAENACVIGTCSSSAALGETCSEQTPCISGAHCVAKADGAICETGDASARCIENADCDVSLWCSQGSCVADLAIGAQCKFDAECAGGSLCVGELASPTGTGVCSRVTRPGDVCDDYCFGALYCEVKQGGVDGICRVLPEKGEPCFISLGRCAGIELYCSDQNACVPLPGLGQTCSNMFCKSGLFCSSELDGQAAGTCLSLLPVGQECSRDGNCASYNCGSDSKCQDWEACRGAAPMDSCH